MSQNVLLRDGKNCNKYYTKVKIKVSWYLCNQLFLITHCLEGLLMLYLLQPRLPLLGICPMYTHNILLLITYIVILSMFTLDLPFIYY